MSAVANGDSNYDSTIGTSQYEPSNTGNFHTTVKSFAEITSCHTIHISENFTTGGYREDTEKTVTGRGVKRARDESDVHGSCSRQSLQGIQYLRNSVPNVQKNFEVISKIGEGTFSSVYLAKVKDGSVTSKVALKHLIPTSSTTRIENEIKCLKSMGGKANVIELKACIRCRDHVVLVMPYFPHDKFNDYLPYITLSEVSLYVYNLFQALRHIHSHRIIHRDIKPSNFLYHRDTRRFRLVDFGLAQLEPAARTSGPYVSSSSAMPPPDTYRRQVNSRKGVVSRRNRHPSVSGNSEKNPSSATCETKHSKNEICEECQSRKSQVASRAGTPGFRAPEVLMKCPDQSTAIDIWSAGVIMLSLLSGHYPFFRAHNDQSALAQIVSLMGSEQCANISTSLGKELVIEPKVASVNLKDICCGLRLNIKTTMSRKSKQPCLNITPSMPTNTAAQTSSDLNGFSQQQSSDVPCSSKTSSTPCDHFTWDNIPDTAFDFLKLSLDVNPSTRITATKALSHSFFTTMGLKQDV